MNTCNLVGHVTRPPIVTFEPAGGTPLCTFTLAIDERSRDGKVYPLYVPCTSYGRSAEACSLLNAQDLVSVQGKLGWHKRKARCGEEHSVLVVSVREVQALQGAAAAATPPPVGWATATPTPAT